MTTTSVALTDAFAAVVAGADTTLLVQNVGINPVQYRVATTGAQSATADVGWLKRYDAHMIYVPTGSSLYAKVPNPGGAGKVTYNATE